MVGLKTLVMEVVARLLWMVKEVKLVRVVRVVRLLLCMGEEEEEAWWEGGEVGEGLIQGKEEEVEETIEQKSEDQNYSKSFGKTKWRGGEVGEGDETWTEGPSLPATKLRKRFLTFLSTIFADCIFFIDVFD